MTYEQYRALTAGERNLLREIENRRQPLCPGCGHEMVPTVQLETHGKRWVWAAGYMCSESAHGCGRWNTAFERSSGVVDAMNKAWQTAMRRAGK